MVRAGSLFRQWRMTVLSAPVLVDLLGLFDSESPAGAGSAAAIGAALGVRLLATVARMPKTGSDPEQVARLAAVDATLGTLGERLLVLAHQDRETYRRLVAAYRLPARTREDQDARRQALQSAMKTATDVPMQIMDACQQALTVAMSLATHGRVRARGEVAVGVELIRAAVAGAGVCIAANLPAIADRDFTAGVTRDRRQLEADAADARETIRLVLAGEDLPAA
jgi:methenyltetrahydrofolate cyclohydrolase